MTTNHPAHGPLSLDRLHQIREILSKAAVQSDGGNLGYAMADAVKVIDGVLAGRNAEPVAWLHSDNGIGIPAITRSRNVADSWFSKGWNIKPLYTAPPAPLEIADLHRKAEIHDALCAKYNVESLADFVDWQRNHIAELEAAPPAPVGPDETAVMPDYPGYVMTQRECFQAGKKAGMAELVTTAYKLRDAVEIIRNPGIEIDAEKIFAERDALNTPDCWCRTCRPVTVTDMRFVVCPECGNKRCPHANDHRNACTGSNEPGQEGGEYPAAPQQEVK
ncbi:TPA: hypothetical protein ACQJWS_002803 [Citrobacter freundii]